MKEVDVIVKRIWFDGKDLHVIDKDDKHIVYKNAHFSDLGTDAIIAEAKRLDSEGICQTTFLMNESQCIPLKK
jgi:hypothetical protein